MVTDPEVLLVSLLGVATLAALGGRVLGGTLRGAELWHVALGATLVGACLAMESNLAGGLRTPLQVVVLGVVGLAIVPRLVALRLHRTLDEHVAASRLPLFVVALSTTALMVNLARNPLAPATEIYARVLAPVFWLLVALAVLLGAIDRRGFVTGTLAAFAAMSALTPFYPDPLRRCVPDKCSVFGSLLEGPYGSENFVSVVAGSVLLLAWTLRRDAFSLLGGATGAVALLAAGGRGSLTGVAVGALAAAALSVPWVRDRVGSWPAATRRGLALTATTTFSVVALLLILRADSSDFSRRGTVWRHGLAAVREHWVLGVGLSRWDGYAGVTPVSHHYPHSQYLLVVFTAGLVGLAMYAVLTAVLLSAAVRTALVPGSGGAGLVGHVLFLLTVGLVEVVANPLAVDGLSWLLLQLLLPTVRQGSGQKAPEPVHYAAG